MVLRSHDEITAVRIEGHSDLRGNAAHNLELSERRAAAVAAYLHDHGVPQPVSSEGFGVTRPLCEEDTDECHDRNRRVEFIITVQQ